MKCPDCNGSGKYSPLVGPAEDCTLCGGSGNVVGVVGELAVPKEYASDGIITENMPLTPMQNPNYQHVAPNRRSVSFVALAQRWDAMQHGLVAGKFYYYEPGNVPRELGSSIRFDIIDKMDDVYRLEFPSKGFRYIVPGDPDYDKTSQDHGMNPCIEHGVLFLCKQNPDFEFFASDETMGPAFVAQISQYVGKEVIINSFYEQAASLYRPTF